MKYFTPDLLERFGSENGDIALAAHEDFERRSEAYTRNLHEIEAKFPPRFRDLLDRFYLHDARVISQPPLVVAELDRLEHVSRSGIPSDRSGFEGQTRCTPSYWIPLQLDTPPNEVLVLHYRLVQIESVGFHESLFEECPYLEWQYDEVELIQCDGSTEFRHSILFTRGLELRLRFKDFDFSTLQSFHRGRETTVL
jgi:hypothetical protein